MSSNPNPIQLVVFDWAGTTVDFGSRAPAAAFANVFAENRVQVSDGEAREPMGMNKREHLVAMLSQPAIAERWQAEHGQAWSEEDVDRMYEQFIPLQLKAIAENSELVPGLLDVVNVLRSRGLKIAGSTGYFREAADVVARTAADAGFQPDANACADDVPQGRPAPWMIFRLMQQLNVYPPSSVIKIGDTVADIKAGLAAGCWSIGVCNSSSVSGQALAEYEALSEEEKMHRNQQTASVFEQAGCHAVINTISELPVLVDRIQQANNATPRVLTLSDVSGA